MGHTTINKMPKEILVWVFCFGDLRDLAHFAMVDRFWFSSLPEVWKHKSSLTITGQMLRNGLAKILQRSCGSSLRKLTLNGLGRRNDEIAAATSCFSSFAALEDLSIDSSYMHDSWLCDLHSEDLFPSVASALSHLVSLRSISFRCCSITSKGMITMGKVLSCCLLHLQFLEFANCTLGGHEGAAALFSSLPQLLQLQSLVLRGCCLGDDGFLLLSSVLKLLPHLTCLDITANAPSDGSAAEGMQALSRELPHCPLLHSVSVGHNSFSPAAQHAFFTALPLLPSLRVLSIPRIRLAHGFSDFVDALPFVAPVLESLNLSGNKFDLTQWSTFCSSPPAFSVPAATRS